MKVLVTGSNGFIGKNLVSWLDRRPDLRVLRFDLDNTLQELDEHLAIADVIYHLAGVNRPQSEDEFRTGNVDLTALICERLLQLGRPTPIILSSSIQALQDNPYGISKRQAEEVLADNARRSGARVIIYRLTNVFGKWCRPNYNSVVATFCHNIAHHVPITISDTSHELELIHVDDVVAHFMADLESTELGGVRYKEVSPSYRVTLGRLADLILSFHESRQTLYLPDLSEEFVRKLYGTYLSYLEADDFAYDLDRKCDPRGCLAEFVKSPSFGQIFVSRTAPGVTRGNHYHHTKAEKFLVLQGQAIIRFRHIRDGDVIEYYVTGEDFRVVDIPTGYTHSIENVGSSELITLFWASEVFDPARADTHFLTVQKETTNK